MLYGSEQEAAMRAAKRLGAGHVALARARSAAYRKASNTKALLEAVPQELRGDPGYIFNKIQLLRREEKFADVAHLARQQSSFDPPFVEIVQPADPLAR